jgi:HTH-type transcriptional regulator/antitoxin HigA
MNMSIELVPTGDLISEYLESNGISQKVLATKSGYSEKQVSLVINNKVRLSERFAEVLSTILPGTKTSFWLSYDEKYFLQEKKENAVVENYGYPSISSKYGLDKIFQGTKYSKYEKLSYFAQSRGLNIDSLNLLSKNVPSFAFLQGEPSLENKRVSPEYVETWLSIMTYFDSLKEKKNIPLKFVGASAVKDALIKNRDLFIIEEEQDLYRNLKYFCKMIGVNLVLTSSEPSTYVRGAVYSSNGTIILVLTNRFRNVPYTLFAFIHEIFHLIDSDVTEKENKISLIPSNLLECHENAISKEARDFFIPGVEYNKLLSIFKESKDRIALLASYSNKCHVSLGMLITFLQHDGVIDYSAYRQFIKPLRDEGQFFDLDCSI